MTVEKVKKPGTALQVLALPMLVVVYIRLGLPTYRKRQPDHMVQRNYYRVSVIENT